MTRQATYMPTDVLAQSFKYLPKREREPSTSDRSDRRLNRLKRARLEDSALGVLIFYPSSGAGHDPENTPLKRAPQ